MPSYEEMRKILDEVDKKFEEREKQRAQEREEELKKMGVEPVKAPKKHIDHPNTMENSTATVLWIASLVVGSIFKRAWLIWVVSTLIWFKFITRHNSDE
jgi:hypothetical protein